MIALVRIQDAEVLALLRQELAGFLEDARSAASSFFDLGAERSLFALTAARVLAAAGDPAMPPILAGLLLQAQRARRETAILESWQAAAGGPVSSEVHTWLRAVLESLLRFPDEIVVDAVSQELDRLAGSGDLFLLGDAAFGVVFRELSAKQRCHRLQDRLQNLVFRCRPDHSPAEFRIRVILGDRSAAKGDPIEAAQHYLRAYFIAKYNPPAPSVIRDLLSEDDPFTGYDSVPSLISEVYSLLSQDRAARGQESEAGALAEWARRRSPFMQLSPSDPPRKLESESEGAKRRSGQ
jgi:hypothetical protein